MTSCFVDPHLYVARFPMWERTLDVFSDAEPYLTIVAALIVAVFSIWKAFTADVTWKKVSGAVVGLIALPVFLYSFLVVTMTAYGDCPDGKEVVDSDSFADKIAADNTFNEKVVFEPGGQLTVPNHRFQCVSGCNEFTIEQDGHTLRYTGNNDEETQIYLSRSNNTLHINASVENYYPSMDRANRDIDVVALQCSSEGGIETVLKNTGETQLDLSPVDLLVRDASTNNLVTSNTELNLAADNNDPAVELLSPTDISQPGATAQYNITLNQQLPNGTYRIQFTFTDEGDMDVEEQCTIS